MAPLASHPLNLTIPSTGSGIAQAILEALERSRLDVCVAGADDSRMAFGLYDCEKRYVVPRIADPAYIPALLDICRLSSTRLLIPALDTELIAIAAAAGRFREQGTEVLVAGEDLVGLCRDKLEWARVFSAALPHLVAPAFDVEEAKVLLAKGKLELPLVAKPRGGSASRGVRVVVDASHLECLPPGTIVQQWLAPAEDDPNAEKLNRAAAQGRHLQLSEFSLQYVFSRRGEPVGRMATINRLKDGVPVEVVPIDYEPLRETLAPLVELLTEHGARGPVNLQGRLTGQGPRFFECNPRFTGITGVRAMLGFNEVDWLIRDWLGLPQAQPLCANMRRTALRQVGPRLVDQRRVAAVVGPGESPSRKAPPNTVAVSGASGWLGRHLISALARSGKYELVRAFVRSDEKAGELREWLEGRGSGVQIVVADGVAFGHGLYGIDLLINLASARPTTSAAEIASSLGYQLDLLREAEALHLPAIINVSSQSVYQPIGEEACRENATIGPAGAYGMMKWAVEQAVTRISSANKAVRTTSLRLSRLYGMGEGMRWSEVPHAFARKAALGEEIELRDRRQRYDLLHLQDAVAAIMFVAGTPEEEWEGVYNVGGGSSLGLEDLAEAASSLARSMGLPGAKVRKAHPAAGEDVSPGAPTQRSEPLRKASAFPVVLDSGRIRAAGWRPQVSLEKGLEELLRASSREASR